MLNQMPQIVSGVIVHKMEGNKTYDMVNILLAIQIAGLHFRQQYF